MTQVVIENPVLNSPFKEPKRHFRFTEDGIPDEIVVPWDAKNTIRKFIIGEKVDGAGPLLREK